jgi:hypothetical protein
MSEFDSNPAAANINFSLLNLTMLIDTDILKWVDNHHQNTNFVRLIYCNKYGFGQDTNLFSEISCVDGIS